MIRSIAIKGFRGIREGSLTDLTPLVVLVGPNGSGKSTIIEGMLIGASPNTADAIVQVIRRHEAGGSGPRWLLWRAGESGPTEITVTTDEVRSRKCQLQLRRGLPAEQTQIGFSVIENETQQLGDGMVFGEKNKYRAHHPSVFSPLKDLSEVRLIEGYPTTFQLPIHELYTKAVQRGRRKDVIGIVSEVFPSVSNIEILTEHGEPILYFVFEDHGVPASLAGDGIQSLLRLSLELASSGGGVAFLEEPEVHQHPGAIRQSARAILAAVRRQIQVVLTTHSLELIDSLLAESREEDLNRLSVYHLRLQDGMLKTARSFGPDVAFARSRIEEDLR
jgi:predicted ATPase